MNVYFRPNSSDNIGLAGIVNNGDCKSKATIEVSANIIEDMTVGITIFKTIYNCKTKYKYDFNYNYILVNII